MFDKLFKNGDSSVSSDFSEFKIRFDGYYRSNGNWDLHIQQVNYSVLKFHSDYSFEYFETISDYTIYSKGKAKYDFKGNQIKLIFDDINVGQTKKRILEGAFTNNWIVFEGNNFADGYGDIYQFFNQLILKDDIKK